MTCHSIPRRKSRRTALRALGEWVDLAPEAWFGAFVASLLPVPLHEWLKKQQ